MAQTKPLDLRKWFRHLALAREDVRDELEWLGEPIGERVGDFGCGNGLCTFALACELPTARCIGVDKQISEATSAALALATSVRDVGDEALVGLVESGRVPRFRQGDVVTSAGLPRDLDLVHCKRLLANIHGGAHENRLMGRDGVRVAVTNMLGALRPGGRLLVLEYSRFELGPILEECGVEVLQQAKFTRHDIRSRGRTAVVSTYASWLCRRA
jgi:SAM-dependent methyltransferase